MIAEVNEVGVTPTPKPVTDTENLMSVVPEEKGWYSSFIRLVELAVSMISEAVKLPVTVPVVVAEPEALPFVNWKLESVTVLVGRVLLP